ncbi:ABC transporter permease [Acidisoma cellulosilytica]|uniref:ABC transporter permease n=1 Tax=Acidisoma cellulosilyticum TaxID=2802395 RepID=A0A964E4X6_9PROT|nr:ABC transporter permease [Acidisoma cellulosilyticum]MCB8881403.1 ABC transporter permease [Acidisoma cellulosilyticum]
MSQAELLAADTGLAPTIREPRFGGLTIFAACVVGIMLVLAVIGPSIAPYNPSASAFAQYIPPPAIGAIPHLLWNMVRGVGPMPHWFGTDASGFDVFSRVISAPRVDLVIAVLANGFALLLGVPIGLIAGYFRNPATEIMMRVSDVVQSFPVFISAMILVALAGQSVVNLVIALAILYAPIYVRLTRSEVMSQKVRGMVEASRAIGLSEMAIAVRHVLPNSLGPTLVQSSVTIGFAILLTAGLSFVGAGVRPPAAEWGLMIATGANDMVLGQWWASVFPGIAISLTVFSFAVLGEMLERHYRN